VSNNALTEILKDDLSYNPKTHSYHIISDGKTSEPVHQFFVKKMIEASELSPKPWLVFWVRLMRNKLYMKNSTKVETLVEYLKAQYLDEAASAKLVEENSSTMANNCLLLIRLASQKRVFLPHSNM
jgi:hypothetical protein